MDRLPEKIKIDDIKIHSYAHSWFFGLIIFICNYEKQRGWATSSLNISYGPPPTI